MPDLSPGDRTDCRALENLADHLGTREYATVLVTGDDCCSCLTVTHRHTRLSVAVIISGGWYCTVPPAQIAPTTNAPATARYIAAALGGGTAAATF